MPQHEQRFHCRSLFCMYLTDKETVSSKFFCTQFLWKRCVVHAATDGSGRDDNCNAINNGFLCAVVNSLLAVARWTTSSWWEHNYTSDQSELFPHMGHGKNVLVTMRVNYKWFLFENIHTVMRELWAIVISSVWDLCNFIWKVSATKKSRYFILLDEFIISLYLSTHLKIFISLHSCWFHTLKSNVCTIFNMDLVLMTFNKKVKWCNCQEKTTQILSLNINVLYSYCTLNTECKRNLIINDLKKKVFKYFLSVWFIQSMLVNKN